MVHSWCWKHHLAKQSHLKVHILSSFLDGINESFSGILFSYLQMLVEFITKKSLYECMSSLDQLPLFILEILEENTDESDWLCSGLETCTAFSLLHLWRVPLMHQYMIEDHRRSIITTCRVKPPKAVHHCFSFKQGSASVSHFTHLPLILSYFPPLFSFWHCLEYKQLDVWYVPYLILKNALITVFESVLCLFL